MEDQLYGRIEFERFLHEPQIMNNLQKIQKQLEPRFCRIHFLEFKDMSDHQALRMFLEEEAHYNQLRNDINNIGTYYTFEEDQWVRFGDYVAEQGGALNLHCSGWVGWSLHVYQHCVDCKDVIDESRPINRYKTLRDEIKNPFRCSSSLYCAAFNTHFPSRYSVFYERSADVEELSFLWSFLKRGGANIFDLPLIDIPYASDECALCKQMGTQWRGGGLPARPDGMHSLRIPRSRRGKGSEAVAKAPFLEQ